MINRTLLSLFIVLAWYSANASSITFNGNGGGNNAYPLIRLKLVLDSFNNDDIAIGFNSAGTLAYNNQLDSRYLPGINPAEGLSSLSSDNVQLSVNIVPLPKTAPLLIRLDVDAQNSGPFTLQRTELDTIPQVYDIWLRDNLTKDSINLRTNTAYAFNINKNDSTTFGSNRFVVVIRQNLVLGFHLLSFSAAKTTVGAHLAWTTENEQDNTTFSVERSIDEGKTFYDLDSLTSGSLGSYSFDDKNPVNGTDEYRVKITDMNATISYTNVVTLDFDSTTIAAEASNNISVYPNPSNGVINLAINPNSSNPSTDSQTLQTSGLMHSYAALPSSSTSYAIKIININGYVVKTASSAAANWQDNVSTLSPGTYVIQVVNNKDKTVVGKSTFIKL